MLIHFSGLFLLLLFFLEAENLLAVFAEKDGVEGSLTVGVSSSVT